MKIAAILNRDAQNLKIARLIKAFLRHGHNVDAYAVCQTQNNLYMCQDVECSIYNISILTKELVEQYDLLLAVPEISRDMHWLIDCNIYIIASDSSYIDEPNVGADLLFERGIGWRPALQGGHRAACARLIAGDPKHDIENYRNFTEDPKQLLFIDSGHYPFGAEGKTAVAHFILDVCKKFPEYHLIVKPRFLKSDTNVTHQNTLFLYDFIEKLSDGRLPENLTLLQEHRILEELIATSHTVITMYTTAYIDAAIQNKNLIILDNLPNEEHPELRIKTHWMLAREIMLDSGCLVDYREAIDKLPEGIPCAKSHIKKHIYSMGAINDKIIRSVEWFWEHYISQGKYPAPGEYFYDELDGSVKETITMEELKDLRKKNHLYCVERLFYKNASYSPKDNRISHYIDELEQSGTLHNTNIDILISNLSEKLLDFAPDIPKDKISQDYLMVQIVGSNKLEKIFMLDQNEVQNKIFYNYIAGRAYLIKGQYENASDRLHDYLNHYSPGASAKSLHDLPNYHISALYYCGLADMQLQHYDDAKQCFMECEKETNGNHIKAKEQLAIIQQMDSPQNATIRLLVMDVDGTLTDGSIHQSAEGEIFKSFHVKDGYGIHVLLPQHQIKSAVITGRSSPVTEYRAKELEIDAVMQNIPDKSDALHTLSQKLQIPLSETAYIGDDLNDLECIRLCGFSACPADAASAIKKEVDYICHATGGQGAVREWIDWIISHNQSQGKGENNQ